MFKASTKERGDAAEDKALAHLQRAGLVVQRQPRAAVPGVEHAALEGVRQRP